MDQDNSNQALKQSPKRRGNFTLLFNRLIVTLLIVIVITMGIYISINKASDHIVQPPVENSSTSPQISNGLLTINLAHHGYDDNFKIFQIKYPASYFVTSDDMLGSYASQGGMAPPKLILMKNYQISADKEPNYFYEITKNHKNDCIVIWSASDSDSIDDWNWLASDFVGTIENKEIISVGSRSADLYLSSKDTGNIYVAYLQINATNNISYYFHTCNANNKNDLVEVIKSIKFRGDINFNEQSSK